MSTRPRDLLTTGQAARLCAVTPDTVLKWIKKGKLSASRTAGGHYRIAIQDLEPFLAGSGRGRPFRNPVSEESMPSPYTGAAGGISSQDGAAETQGDVPCWEYLAEDGDVRQACKQCVVYRVRATRCFLMAGLDTDVGHARQFCEGSCEDCIYYRRLKGLSTLVLFITSDEDLVRRIDLSEDEPVTLRFARNGYEASAIVQDFMPEVAIIDMEGLPDQGIGLLDSIAADPRVPRIRVVLVVTPGMMERMKQRPRHRLVVSMLEKPQVCSNLADIVRRSVPEIGENASSSSASSDRSA